jgi:uroporphyrinogen-III decarboxylase
MSYQDGWAAINLDMPSRVPRTEYSVTRHWDVVRAVTGMDVNEQSPAAEQARAGLALEKAWSFDFRWSIWVHQAEFKDKFTDMGHADYAAGGVDRREDVFCPYTDPEQVLSFDFEKEFGRRPHAELVKVTEDRYRANCATNPDAVNMTGIYITLISGFTYLFGWEMQLMAAGTDPERFGELANRYCDWMEQYFQAMADADVPVIMIHDDFVWNEGAIFHPDWYRTYAFPNYKRLFAPIIESGKKLIFTSDGNYTDFIDDVAGCGVHGFVLEPCTDMAYLAENYGQTHSFVGNADCRVLLSGSREQIRAEVERCMAIGKQCPGFIMAVGNHIPANTPVENVLYYNEVYEELSKR